MSKVCLGVDIALYGVDDEEKDDDDDDDVDDDDTQVMHWCNGATLLKYIH